jgi:outer membrane protein OmpA-like peptidoglycan-associated protein
MLGTMMRRRSRGASEGEKPFWISYADLMTAMMTLFLAAMAVTMVAITREVEKAKAQEVIRAEEIKQICNSLESSFKSHPFINVDCTDNRISFGEAGRFGHNDYRLSPEAGKSLAQLVPVVLSAADGELGRKWFKQVVIEGFTDTDGSYLYNLDLSLKRSEWVMCLLLDPRRNTDLQLTSQQLQRVRDLFLAGGVSFNNAKQSKDASRRVELRLQFYGQDEREAGIDRPSFHSPADDRCMLL